MSEFFSKYGKPIVAGLSTIVGLGVGGLYDTFEVMDIWITLAALFGVPAATWYAPATTANKG